MQDFFRRVLRSNFVRHARYTISPRNVLTPVAVVVGPRGKSGRFASVYCFGLRVATAAMF